jgi:hypothetical protein
MTFRIAFHENDVQIWFMEGNWNSWIFQFIYQSYIIKLNEKSQPRIFKLGNISLLHESKEAEQLEVFGKLQNVTIRRTYLR